MVKYELQKDPAKLDEVLDLYKIYFSEVVELMKTNTYMYSVAMDGSKLVGCIGIKKTPRNLYRMLHVVVIPEYRGKGIANNLIHITVKHCIDDGAFIIEDLKTYDSIFSRDKFDNMGFIERRIFNDQHGVKRIQFNQEVKKLNYDYLNKEWKFITG